MTKNDLINMDLRTHVDVLNNGWCELNELVSSEMRAAANDIQHCPKTLDDAIDQMVSNFNKGFWKVQEIKEYQFRSYQKVQYSGKYNMIMDAEEARLATCLSAYEYDYIARNYKSLYEKFGDLKVQK